MVIDCTGHGVPGAFVTMLVKAIERELVAKINKSDFDIDPAIALQYFNVTMKKLLSQEDDESIANAGFDGGIIYINKKEKILRYSGAYTELFYIEDNQLTMIKGDRYSIGYKNSDPSFEFTTHTVDIKKGMKFYISTDGFLDQKGGDKGFCFGKKKFKKLLLDHHNQPMEKQEDIFIDRLKAYQGEYFKVDDITLIGLEI